MRIVLATPLYPPEIALPAPYVKELAKRLARSHEVTIVAYARLPEQVDGVRIIAVDKGRPLPLRLLSYFFALLKEARRADVVYAMNGASVELPAALVALITARPLIFHIGDVPAHNRAKQRWLRRTIERFSFAHASKVLTDMPPGRPEILPLQPPPTSDLAAYEEAWRKHVDTLETIFSYGA